jgi:GNAT superfamily N-acetyltransferase
MESRTIQVDILKTRKQRNAFLKLPWAIYRDDPLWVPPLLVERKAFINPKKNPFFEHAEVALFLARDNRRPVGRIAAIINHNHNAFHNDRVGFFGLFDCLPNYEIARTLFDRASKWIRDRGMEVLRGPASFSTNEEVGLLVEGFDESPVILMPYNPAYYLEFMERYGFQKAKDLYAYVLSSKGEIPERLFRIVEKLKKQGHYRIRKLDMKDLGGEILRFKEVYTAAWERNWGFIPMTEAEIDHMAKELKQILDPDLAFFVETGGEIVGFSLTLPDINQALKRINGRLLPLGLFKLLYYSKKINQVRVLLLGVIKPYRRKGIDAILYLETFREGLAKGYYRGEFSWLLEDNLDIIRPLEGIGARHYKTYRIYDLPL